MRELVMYATAEDGDGHVMEVGRFADPTDIVIRTGFFGKDIVLNFEWEGEEDSWDE